MNVRSPLILIMLSQLGAVLCRGAIPMDDHFFKVMNAALEAQGQSATNFAEKETNAEAFYLLAVKASETKPLSNSVRFAVAASAIEASERCIWAIPHTSTDWKNFAASSEISAALFLLSDSSKTLARIPAPPVIIMDVDPPIWTPGPTAGGMDPNGIQDPKARAEYERRIAENSRASDELNSRADLERAMNSLVATIKGVSDTLDSEGRAGPLKAAIKNSQLPPEIKTRILGDGDKR